MAAAKSSSNTAHLRNVDRALKARLEELTAEDNEFWAFRNATDRAGASSLYQYPAMMVPEMQRVLIESVVGLQPGIRRLVDPFMGSATILKEGMSLGLGVTGQDINPLAVLIGHARCTLLSPGELSEAVYRVTESVRADRSELVETSFPGLQKWFLPQASVELSRLRRSIRAQQDLRVRRFLWATLAETVRLTSNSRTSTYKLHIRSPQDMSFRSPLTYFQRLLDRNVRQASIFYHSLSASGYVVDGQYIRDVLVHMQDTSERIEGPNDGYDLLVTSPPYGDNQSTVPYGQSSYLPLQWIDLQDIDPTLDDSWLVTTQEIDRRSLGGRTSRPPVDEAEQLLDFSPSLATVVRNLQSLPEDRTRRVMSFFLDLYQCIPSIARCLKPNAYLLWTVGNRCVGGLEIPMSTILVELSSRHGLTFVAELERNIIFKRMAARNQISSTMKSERTVIFRKKSPT